MAKYKKMEDDQGQASTSAAAPSAAPVSLSAAPASASAPDRSPPPSDEVPSYVSRPSAQRPSSSASSEGPSMADHLSQFASAAANQGEQLMNSLPLFRQRGEVDDGQGVGGAGGANNNVGQLPYLQLSIPTPFGPIGLGGIGGSGAGIVSGESPAAVAPTPVPASLQQPALHGGGKEKDGERRPRSGSVQEGSSKDKGSKSSPSKAIALTRTFSTPESSRKYKPLLDIPLGGNDSGEDEVDLCSDNLCMDNIGGSERVKKVTHGEEAFQHDLKQAYPLLLQRSASSAFGSPSCSSFSRFRGTRRTQSNSGNSDPGASAFHPVWSCKSLSSGGSMSGSNVGSDIGSAVSSSAGHSSLVRSTHSDPLGDKKKYNSPWRRVVARMKKKGGKGSVDKSFKRTLSGRENPARPNLLSDDESSPVSELNELPVVVVPAQVGAGGDEIVEDLSKLQQKGEGDTTASKAGKSSEPTTGSTASSKKSSSGSRGSKKASSGKKASSRKKPKPVSETESEPAKVDAGKEESLSSASSRMKKLTEHQQHYEDPGVALDLSESDDNDDDDNDTFEPIVGGSYIPLDAKPQSKAMSHAPRPPSIEIPCDSVEVISTSVTPTSFHRHPSSQTTVGSVQIFSPGPTTIEENSPPSVERIAVVEEGEKEGDFPYHPLGEGQGEGNDSANVQGASNVVPTRLKYRSPQRSTHPPSGKGSLSQKLASGNSSNSQHSPSSHDSPDSRLSSSGGSPASRISSSSTRASAATGSITLNSGTVNTLHSAEDGGSLAVDGTDSEVREATRRLRGRQGSSGNQEVIGGGPDGSETVFSSSTASTNYHPYAQSPRPPRDGATVPVDRFFAGGNIALSPSPQRTVYPASSLGGEDSSNMSAGGGAPTISKFIALSPKKLSRVAHSGTSSPHTVSSNSVSAGSSSSGEAKKPLKFVAYEIREEDGGRVEGSPFDEPPVSRYVAAGGGASHAPPSASSLIKPRISKVIGQQERQRVRPPMIQRPPQSPRKPEIASFGRLSAGARTPTRTPPPSSHREAYLSSGANTPCSPPVIVDGPTNPNTLLCGDLSVKPTRRYVVRSRSSKAQAYGGGAAGEWKGMHLIPPSASYRPPNQQQHGIQKPIPSQPSAAVGGVGGPVMTSGANDGAQEIVFASGPSSAAAVSPERSSLLHSKISKDKCQDQKEGGRGGLGDSSVAAVVSPEKGGF